MNLVAFYRELFGIKFISKLGILYNRKFYYFSRKGLLEESFTGGDFKFKIIDCYDSSKFENFVLGTKSCKYDFYFNIKILSKFSSLNSFSMYSWVLNCIQVCSSINDVNKFIRTLTED